MVLRQLSAVPSAAIHSFEVSPTGGAMDEEGGDVRGVVLSTGSRPERLRQGCKGRRESELRGRVAAGKIGGCIRPSAVIHRLKVEPMGGATDVQGGPISTCSAGGDGGGDEHPGGSAGVWVAPGHGAQDSGLLRAAGLPAANLCTAPQPFDKLKRSPTRGSSARPWKRITTSPRSSATPRAHLRAAQDKVRVWRCVHYGQGLRSGASPPDAGDVRAVVTSAGSCPVRLRRGPGDHRRSPAEGSLPHTGPAPQRRLFRQGVPGRGLSGGPCVRLCPLGRGSPEHPVRQYQAGGG